MTAEEEQRISLKDRLQNVIESNIRLENRAKAGEVAIEIVRKDHLVELNRIKVFYESEMCEARRLLDDQADEYHREQIKTANLKRELEALRKLNGETEKTLEVVRSALESSEDRYDRTNLNLTQKTRDVKQLEEDVKRLTKENCEMSGKITVLNAQLSTSSTELHATQNKLQSAEEMTAMKNQLLEDFIALRKNQEAERIERIETHPTLQPTEELAESFRNEILQIQENEQKKKNQYEMEIKTLKKQVSDFKAEASGNHSKFVIAEKKIASAEEQHKKELQQLEEENRKILIEIEKLKDNQVESEQAILERDTEIEKLNKIADSLQESDIKKELTTFESLLKTEEDRLGIASRKRPAEQVDDKDSTEESDAKKQCSIM